MANTDKPKGLIPVRYLNGSPYNGQVKIYYIPATDGTAVFRGDVVKRAAGADTTGKYPTVAQAAATDIYLVGVVVGFGLQPEIAANPDNLAMSYRAADTAMYVAVVDDPNVIFEAQEDGTMAYTAVGQNADLVVGSGSTTTGLSGMEIDSSDAKNTTAQLRVMRLVDRPDNAIGANAKWEVMIVEHIHKTSAVAGS